MLRIDNAEVCRYLGYRGNAPDERVLRLIDECLTELQGLCQPTNALRRVTLQCADADTLVIGSETYNSRALCRHLRGCTEAYLFAATLGTGADMLLSRYQRVRMSRAVVLQAVAASAIECYCDDVTAALQQTLLPEGLHMRPRFSPGYADLSLEAQVPLLRALDSERRCGIHLNERLVMIPEKSVSAIIGLSDTPRSCDRDKCAACTYTDCAYRKLTSKEDCHEFP